MALQVLGMMLTTAVREGLIVANPVTLVERPRVPAPNPQILTPEQVAALAAAVPSPYGLLLDVLAYGGLRLSEARGLRRRDFDPLGGRLIVGAQVTEPGGHFQRGDTKTHQSRSVPLGPDLCAALRAHLDGLAAHPDTVMFQSRTGGHFRDGTLRRHLQNACTATGLDITPHNLRASCASWVAETRRP
jgi:integrase